MHRPTLAEQAVVQFVREALECMGWNQYPSILQSSSQCSFYETHCAAAQCEIEVGFNLSGIPGLGFIGTTDCGKLIPTYLKLEVSSPAFSTKLKDWLISLGCPVKDDDV